MDKVQKFCYDLAKEISERNIMNVEEVSNLINVSIQSNIHVFIEKHSNVQEGKYLELLRQQQNFRVGSKEYVAMGYKLALQKAEKAHANRAMNTASQANMYSRLKQFIKLAYPNERIIDRFHESEMKSIASFSTDK